MNTFNKNSKMLNKTKIKLNKKKKITDIDRFG